MTSLSSLYNHAESGAIFIGGCVSGGYVTRSGTNLLFSVDKSPFFFTYNGYEWVQRLIPDAGVTVACTGLSNSTDYYLYGYDNAGTITLDLSTTAPTTFQGVRVKTNATDRLLLARCRSNASGAIVTYAQDGAVQLVQNEYNKRLIHLFKQDSASDWSYNSGTWRCTNNSTSNRVEFVTDGKQILFAENSGMTSSPSANWAGILPGIGLDSTTVNSSQINHQAGGTQYFCMYGMAKWFGKPDEGYHYLQALEAGAGCDYPTPGSITVSIYNKSPNTWQETQMSAGIVVELYA